MNKSEALARSTRESIWKAERRKQVIKTLSPRLQKDIKQIKALDTKVFHSSFIYGDVGTGKTVAAAFMLLHYLHEDYVINKRRTTSHQFVAFDALLKEIKSTYNDPKKSEYEVLNKYLSCDILVLDDFLTSKPTDWVMDILYHLINTRYEQLKTTIITSNLSLEEIEKLTEDQRIPRRVKAMCEVLQKKKWK